MTTRDAPSGGADTRRGQRSRRFRAGRFAGLTVATVAFALLATIAQAGPSAAADPPIFGDIRIKWDQLGGLNGLGRPLDAEHPTFDGTGRTQTFQFGIISWHPSIGAHGIWGQIMGQWLGELGRERYGFPITDESSTPDGVGRFNHFRDIFTGEERSIYWTPANGPQPVFGDIRAAWAVSGWELGPLGYPTTREFEPEFATGLVRQNFDKGHAVWTPLFGTQFHPLPSPVRTDRFVILRCKFRDLAAEPHGDQYFREFFTAAGRGKGGFADYVEEQTSGRTAVRGEIRGWYTMSMTRAQAGALPQGAGRPDRDARFQNCVDAAAAAGYRPPSGTIVVTAVNDGIDGWGGPGRVYLDNAGLFPRFAFHELLHGMGLGHSFSDAATNAEYDDPWDQMSAQNNWSYPTKYFGDGPVGLNAYHRERIGGFAASDIRTINASTTQVNTQVEALESPITTVPQVLKVNFDGRVFYVEYRRPLRFSQGIPLPTVLIHEVKDGRSILLRDKGNPPRDPMQTAIVRDRTFTKVLTIQMLGTSSTTANMRIWVQ